MNPEESLSNSVNEDPRTENQQQADPPLATDHAEQHGVAIEHRKPASGQPKPEKPRATNADWSIVAFTGVLTIVAIVQGCFMFKQISQTDENLKLAQQGQRAWVKIAYPKVHYFKEDGDMSAEFSIINSGPTPATINHSVYDFVTGKDWPEIDKQVALVEASTNEDGEEQTVISPGTEVIEPCSGQIGIKAEEYPLVLSGKIKCLLICHIRYRDVFGETRHTQWCFAYHYEKGAESEHNLSTERRYNYMR
jgi:hypothetical protein